MDDMEELRSLAEQIRAQLKAKPENKDKSDDEIDEMILDVYLKAYTEGEISKGDLEAMAHVMGYEFTDEFANDPKAVDDFQGVEEEGAAEEGEGGKGMSKETLENTRTIDEGESVEDFKDKIEDAKEGKEVEGEEETETETEDESEDEDENEFEDEEEEKKKASELWKMKF